MLSKLDSPSKLNDGNGIAVPEKFARPSVLSELENVRLSLTKLGSIPSRSMDLTDGAEFDLRRSIPTESALGLVPLATAAM